MTDLRGADSLLQKAIKRVDNRNQMDTAQVTYIYLYCIVIKLVYALHAYILALFCA